MCEDPWAERRWGCCTERLLGGWFRGQRPYSWDGPLASREGLNRADGRLPERFVGPNIGTTNKLIPTPQLARTVSPRTLFPLRLEFHNISITFLSHDWKFSSDCLKQQVALFSISALLLYVYVQLRHVCGMRSKWNIQQWEKPLIAFAIFASRIQKQKMTEKVWSRPMSWRGSSVIVHLPIRMANLNPLMIQCFLIFFLLLSATKEELQVIEPVIHFLFSHIYYMWF